MKSLATIPAILVFLTAFSPKASAIVTLGPSTQNFGLTGIGANASGEGQNTVTFGSCAYDGTTTTCTVSGPFTGLGQGGTYSFVITYPGNGPFPLIAVSQSPGSNYFSYQANSNFDLVITLAETNGPTINFYSFANFSFFYNDSAVCTLVTSCAVGQVGLTTNATITGPITGTFDPTPSISEPTGVISASNYGGFTSIAPATWIEIYGVNLANTRGYVWGSSDFNGNQAPDALQGTTVTVGGIPAFIDYVSPGQVNAQVPSGVSPGPQQVVVTTAGGTSDPFTITVNPVEPGLLAPLSFMINGKQYVVALYAGTTNYYVLPGSIAGGRSAPAKAGDNITLYGIGFGPVTPDTPAGQVVQGQSTLQNTLQVSFGGVAAKVTYKGLTPGYLGLYQFNVVVPNVPSGQAIPVTFTLNGTAVPQTLYTAVQ